MVVDSGDLNDTAIVNITVNDTGENIPPVAVNDSASISEPDSYVVINVTDNDYDPDIYPTYYYDEFSVSSSETQTSTQPDLLFQVTVDKGSDTASVTVHIAVYDLDQSSFDSMTSGGLSGADEYILGSGDLTDEPVNHYIDLHNYADTYTWVLWFETSEKSDTWSCDITITLRYNWS
jgi:hypothetical protein